MRTVSRVLGSRALAESLPTRVENQAKPSMVGAALADGFQLPAAVEKVLRQNPTTSPSPSSLSSLLQLNIKTHLLRAVSLGLEGVLSSQKELAGARDRHDQQWTNS